LNKPEVKLVRQGVKCKMKFAVGAIKTPQIGKRVAYFAVKTVVIDEIQKCTELLPLVRSLIEDNPDLQLILTSSSSHKLKAKGIDLLGGRAVRATLHPFMVAELDQEVQLDDVMQYGLLPICFTSKDRARTLDFVFQN
jgi:predicted AAA+ superfamily ATPase